LQKHKLQKHKLQKQRDPAEAGSREEFKESNSDSSVNQSAHE